MNQNIQERLIGAALSLDTPRQFRAVWDAVAAVAPALDPFALEALADQFGLPPDVPPAFRPAQENRIARKAAWGTLWEETLAEAFLQCRERGLSALRRIAFGGEDCVQGWGIHLLCRLAALGVGREQFFQDVRREFPRLNENARMLVMDELRSGGNSMTDRAWRFTVSDPAFAASAESLKDLPGYRAAQRAASALDTSDDG